MIDKDEVKIEDIYFKIKELSSTSGKNDKLAILEKYKGDWFFKFTLNFLLNPFVLTRISTKKVNKEILEPFDVSIFKHDFDTIHGLMCYLNLYSSGRDYDICVVQNFINKQPTEELKKFVTQIVTKDLKLGVSEKTVNKVFGKGTIPEFGVMLAESYEKKQDKVKGKFYITLKLDGNRCLVVKEDGAVKFYTRKGQPIEGLLQLSEEFTAFPDNRVFDGELILKNKDNLNSAELFRATQKVVRKDGEKVDLEFHMFDTLPLSEFKAGKSKKKYSQRRNELELMFGNIGKVEIELDFVKIVEVMYEGDDKSVIPAYAIAVEKQGFEGLMINTADGLYQTKRVVDLQKVKSMKTADLLVMNIEKAIDGQFEGLLGRVNVEYKGNLVGVGSGFTLEQRRLFIENPDEICGKVIEVQFFEESKDEKTGEPSLRFPVFKGIRHDKGLEDVNYGE
jgi:DNA ligase 1